MWIDILVLGHLVRGPAHGYEIKQRVGRSIGQLQPLNNNVLYPALRRLDEMGAVRSEIIQQQASPPRRVYELTEHGIEVLRGIIEDFPEESALNDGEFNTRLAYFELIDPKARLEILRVRARAVEKLLEHLRRSRAEAAADRRHPYAPRLVEFLIGQRESEIRFLEDMAREELKKEEEEQ
jgi:DNA-binding PadR family transcriptional regulator